MNTNTIQQQLPVNAILHGDSNADWLKPAMREAYRVLKINRVAVMFYSWNRVNKFFDAWKDAGFQPLGHIVFRKTYSSSSRFLSYQHEQAYLLAKGRAPLPKQPVADVIDMPYSGNKLIAHWRGFGSIMCFLLLLSRVRIRVRMTCSGRRPLNHRSSQLIFE